MKILINAANLTGAGSQSLATSLLPEITSILINSEFVITLPDIQVYRDIAFTRNCRCIFSTPKSGMLNDIDRAISLFYHVPKLADETQADICLTLGDLAPARLNCPSLLLLHQPLLVYGKDDLGKIAPWPWFKKVVINAHFFLARNNVHSYIVQTPVMSDRLARKFKIDKKHIHVIPQPVPKHVLNNFGNNNVLISKSPKKLKLLFLAGYYKHKNHKILASVAGEIRNRRLQEHVQIFTTIDMMTDIPSEIKAIVENNTDIVTNLGRLRPEEVSGALNASTALFLPTLVESYGLIYLEAMECNKPILTSDRDFARWICGDLGMYFNPFSAESIVDVFQTFMNSEPSDLSPCKVKKHLSAFPVDWHDVGVRFSNLLMSHHCH